jgi:hypothetical protein
LEASGHQDGVPALSKSLFRKSAENIQVSGKDSPKKTVV